MKKFKFPILLKVILAGILVSFVASGTAIFVSYNNHVDSAKKAAVTNVDNTLNNLAYYYQLEDESQNAIKDLITIKEHVKELYDQRKADGRDLTLENFNSFKEYEQFYKDEDSWIYPRPGEMGLSKDILNFRVIYRELTNSLFDAKLSSGSIASYLAYRDIDGRLVFLADSRMITHQAEVYDYYQVPGSYYQLKDSDVNTDEGNYSTFYIYGRTTRFFTVYEDAAKTNAVAMFFIEYDESAIVADSTRILKSELLVLGLTAVAIVLIYALLSYFLFVRNVNRLSKTYQGISEKLATNSLDGPVEVKIRSHDEISNLAVSLDSLQKAIFDYAEIIKKEANDKERLNAELEVASRIQVETLPPFSFDDTKLSLRAYIKAAKEIGGDFYDYFYLDESRFAVVIADVSGKGIPASLFMMRSKAVLKSAITSTGSLEEAIFKANNSLVKNNKENLFVTAFVGVIDFANKTMTFVNSGHEKPYILSNGKAKKLDGNSNFVIGEIADFIYKEETVKFEEDDILFMFTDGLNESINDNEEEFGYGRIVEHLEKNKDNDLRGIIDSMNDGLSSFAGDKEAFDDVTMVVLTPAKETLTLEYHKKDYSIITEVTDAFNDHFDSLPIKTKSEVGIILDELVNNLVSYEEREDLVIKFEFIVKDEKLIFKIISNGNDFNPFKNHKNKYFAKADDVTGIGGFGIKIVKDLVDLCDYEYHNGHSIVTLIKSVNK